MSRGFFPLVDARKCFNFPSAIPATLFPFPRVINAATSRTWKHSIQIDAHEFRKNNCLLPFASCPTKNPTSFKLGNEEDVFLCETSMKTVR